MSIDIIPPSEGRKPAPQTLQKRYPIRYRKAMHVPVQLLITGNNLRIRFFVRYSKKFQRFFPGTNITYADIFEAGVRLNWSGKYPLEWMADDGYEIAKAKATFRVLTHENNPSASEVTPHAPSARVAVEFVRHKSPEAINHFPKQRFFKISFSSLSFMPAHVISSPWRWYWGFFRSFQLESTHLNWSRRHPGKIVLQKNLSRHKFQQTGAHEIGHILGLGDAYGANYRFYYEAPNTGTYMMCHNRRVQPEEIQMVLHAHYHNHMQYFPKKFILKVFISGIQRTIKLKINPISRNDKKRRRELQNASK